jgi:uncharacterized protein
MKPKASASAGVFFLLVFFLSIPFYLLGAAGGRLPVVSILPTSGLMAFMPMIAALILVYRAGGMDGAAALLKRAFDFSRIHGVRCILQRYSSCRSSALGSMVACCGSPGRCR